MWRYSGDILNNKSIFLFRSLRDAAGLHDEGAHVLVASLSPPPAREVLSPVELARRGQSFLLEFPPNLFSATDGEGASRREKA